ncbi:hypothetical protein SAMN05216223_12914 [Actinacidiphila yanglinensis]|uniref:Small integral membrane protein n=1 Tax=Actinacidiphila yanglinensis TaxID=310779 RepID=A0A1H6E8J0_9ACTN|nr:hypothetical protein [Actinacidiphila yanglinensis]SEG94017.1 hypothetical protein SAMN05216223_12914 [Actinacidiphila yanglinensis]
MNTTVAGLVTGLALGFAGYFGGFGAFVVVAVVGLAGLVVGWLSRRDGPISTYLRSREGQGIREVFEHPRADTERQTNSPRPRGTSATTPGPRAASRPEQRTRVH